jgi:hypothetical protein
VDRIPCDVAVAGLLDRDWAGPADRFDETGAPASESRIRQDSTRALFWHALKKAAKASKKPEDDRRDHLHDPSTI